MENMGDKIKNLREQLAVYERQYRLENAPTIDDFTYDRLLKELHELEKKYPQFADKNSPTKKIGDDSAEGFEKCPHLSRMLSLDNAFTPEDFLDFDERLKKVLNTQNDLRYAIEPKIDGAGISAVYEHGNLARLLTRGDGEKGDDITKNASVIKNLPLKLKGENIPELLEIRGEAYMRNSDFDKIRQAQIKEFEEKKNAEFDGEISGAKESEKKEKTYANPRNLAAGTLKLLDKKVLETRELYATFYSIGKIIGSAPDTQFALSAWLENLGLPSMRWTESANNAADALQKILQLEHDRSGFDFNTDGAVVKLDDTKLHALAGWTSKAPRWAIAWKYKALQASALLWKISLQVGRTGAITPVAELEDPQAEGKRKPILLSGSNVARATLHNFEEIIRKDIREGDTVSIEKAGEIIPIVVNVNLKKRPKNSLAFKEPTHCPACSSSLVRNQSEAILRCINPECPEQARRRIIHFASRGCMNIDGLGEAVVSEMLEQKLINNCADLYFLSENELSKIKNFKEKSVANLLHALAESKNQELWRLICGLGIPFVGERVAKDLALEFKSLDKLSAADFSALKNVNGVGEKIIFSLLSFFQSPENLRIIERLRSANLNFSKVISNENSDFAGKIFVLTGTLKSMGRTEAKNLIESHGGRVASGVSASTNFLISASENSSKLKTAIDLGVKIINEKEFLALLNQDNKTSPSSSETIKKSDEQNHSQLSLF